MKELNPAEINLENNITEKVVIRVFGVGDAGSRIISQMAESRTAGIDYIAINTDALSINQTQVPKRFLIGKRTARGMGAGGDPEKGCTAALEDIELLKSLCSEANIVFIVAGLGRGTGCGVSPLLAKVAKECGALVLGIITMPFGFEGAETHRQAFLGLKYLREQADGVVCIKNEKFLGISSGTTLETFNIANEYLAESVFSLWRILTLPGSIKTSFADLCSILRDKHSDSSIAVLKARGENRDSILCEQLSRHPVFDTGDALSRAENILINFTSAGDVKAAEIKNFIEYIKRGAKKADIKVGESIDNSLNGEVIVTVIAVCEMEDTTLKRRQRLGGEPTNQLKDSRLDLKDQLIQVTEEELNQPSKAVPAPPPPVLSQEQLSSIYSQQSKKGLKTQVWTQGKFNFEVISHGRFEKSAPTIHNGENLDIPTFYRRGIKLN